VAGQRAEIGNGSNPHWHQPTDVYAAFSAADFRLGFNATTAPAQP
jgi:hypothetical protein